MLFVISSRLPERGAGLREFLGFLFVSQTNHAAGPLAVQRLMRINVTATELVDDVSLSASPWGEVR